MEKYSKAELAFKIDNEGGIYNALLYGISARDVPEDVQEAWVLLEEAFKLFRRREDAVEALLPDPWEIADDDV